MIRDYKSKKIPGQRRRKGWRRIILASLVLTGTIAAVKHTDLTGVAVAGSAVTTDAGPVSAPLALPATTSPATQQKAESGAALPSGARSVEVSPVRPEAGKAAGTVEQDKHPHEMPVVDNQLSLLGGITEATRNDASTTEAAGRPGIVETEALQPTQVEPTASAAPTWIEHKVAKGESLARIFSAQGLEPGLLHRIVNSDATGKKLAQIRPGQRFRFSFDDQGELQKLELHRNRVESIHVAIADDAITFDEISKDVEKRVASAAGIIESSLFVDAQKAGMSDSQIMNLAEVFGWDIDFALEIRAGDHFRVLYEEHYLDGEKLRDGPILAAEFTNRGTTFSAVRYEDKHGEIGYYNAEGESKRRAFIRSPIKFARVSSRYNPRRWHPVLKRWRSHKGVDYAAPKGTAIRATGDGRVIFRGRKNGYGKTVIVEHAGKYTTLYAHMSGYSKRSAKGKRVKQGQVIGYVGKTGLATGPHLHYEFRVNGKHRDPLRVKLPKSLSLAKSELARFRKTTAPLLAQLEAVPSETMVASAESSLAR